MLIINGKKPARKLNVYVNGKRKTSGGAATIFTKHIIDTNDDGYVEGATFYGPQAFISIGDSAGVSRNLFVRFQNILIPKNATISNAYISLYAYNTASTANAKAIIYGNDVDDSSWPISSGEYNALVITTANVTWAMPNTTAGEMYDTPDIASVIQEIVNRDLWGSGNALTILLKNNISDLNARRSFIDFSAADGKEAVLNVTFTP
jgi:hypothetical protein